MNNVKAVVLAAGKGTRLHSEAHDLPKVLREANGKPLLHYVLSALDFLPKENTVIVAGYRKEKVMAAFPDYPYAIQAEQKGTATPSSAAKEQLQGFSGEVLVCCRG